MLIMTAARKFNSNLLLDFFNTLVRFIGAKFGVLGGLTPPPGKRAGGHWGRPPDLSVDLILI